MSCSSRTDIFLKRVYESVQEMNIGKDKRRHRRPFGNEALSKHQRSRLKLLPRGAGIPKNLVPRIGIGGHRHRNKSFEGLQTIVQLLKTYKAKLVVFPRHACKFKNYSWEAACEF
ncbi:hypothetical protein C5167_032629 [Papaver somniferum]|uniref:Uncharacterized protein n=1 Tax=Papaver somniferum TaxID=3469 RepID=A0A4Y7K808_PAPSO|nr:hypothetical protein C5167_032629 [Papaver somniferum]